jgi:hypothetical protein
MFDDILNIFGRFVTEMGAMFIAYGVAMYAFKKLKEPWALVAAGAALVAIGTAITTSHSSFASNPEAYSGGGGSVYGGYNASTPTTISSEATSLKFTVEGKDLVAVMDRNEAYNNMNT